MQLFQQRDINFFLCFLFTSAHREMSHIMWLFLPICNDLFVETIAKYDRQMIIEWMYEAMDLLKFIEDYLFSNTQYEQKDKTPIMTAADRHSVKNKKDSRTNRIAPLHVKFSHTNS